MLRKFGIIAVLSLLAVAIAAVPATAVTTFNELTAPTGAHYRSGFAEPVCAFDETTNSVTCTETRIAGVGNANANTTLTLNIQADVVCRNPGNRNIVEPHSYTDDVTVGSPLLRARNGTLVAPSTTATAPSPSEVDAAFQCPNPRWQDEVTAVNITGFTYTLQFVGFPQPAITISG